MIAYKSKKKGMTGILDIAYECYRQDRRGSYNLDFNAFSTALNRAKLDLAPQEIDMLFDYLESSSCNGTVDYYAFVNSLKEGGTGDTRRNMVIEAFHRFDYKGQDVIDLRMIGVLFNPRNHFDVKGGRRTQDEIAAQFSDSLKIFTEINNNSGVVNFEKFIEFWEYLSPSVAKDSEFEEFLRAAFRYNELPNKGVRSKKSDIEKFEKKNKYAMESGNLRKGENPRLQGQLDNLRTQLSKGGPKKMFHFYQNMKHNDHDNDGKLVSREFIRTFGDMRLSFPESELFSMIQSLDTEKSGFISIPQFMCTFVPELNPARNQVVSDLLDALQSASDPNCVTLTNIKKFFFPRGHVDFISRKRADYDIKQEFFSMLNTFLGLSGGVHEIISKEILLQFFEIFSNAYPEDDEFCDILIGSFRMDKICGRSRVHSSHLDRYSDQDSVSANKSNLHAPFGTQEDLPGQKTPSIQSGYRGGHRNYESRPQSSQGDSVQGDYHNQYSNEKSQGRNSNRLDFKKARQERIENESQYGNNTPNRDEYRRPSHQSSHLHTPEAYRNSPKAFNHGETSGESRRHQNHHSSPYSNQAHSRSGHQGHEPTLEEVRHAIIHQ